MEQNRLNWIANFIWGIADDVLRDLYVRGKYRDVILPMTVLRRLDTLLEPTKHAVLDMKGSLDKSRITNQNEALRHAAGQAFYNTSTAGDTLETFLDAFPSVARLQATSAPELAGDALSELAPSH